MLEVLHTGKVNPRTARRQVVGKSVPLVGI